MAASESKAELIQSIQIVQSVLLKLNGKSFFQSTVVV